jgi:hypothetical protein
MSAIAAVRATTYNVDALLGEACLFSGAVVPACLCACCILNLLVSSLECRRFGSSIGHLLSTAGGEVVTFASSIFASTSPRRGSLEACENQAGCRADISVFEVGSSPLGSGVPERKVLRSTSAAPIRLVAS